MAAAISLLPEDQFLCSICLEVFTKPVAIPCGHNFCMHCITQYWDSDDSLVCKCPLCSKAFDKKPDLHVNVFIATIVDQFRNSVEVKHDGGDVPCDFCEEKKSMSLKTCLNCLASYCETHLEPHMRISVLKKHMLIDPLDQLENRVCKRHGNLLQLFCKTDQMYVCRFCMESEHKLHSAVPLEEEFTERMAELVEKQAQIQQMIQERCQKVTELKHSVNLHKKDVLKEISESITVFTTLMASIEKTTREYINSIEESHKVMEHEAEVMIKKLDQEMTDLQKRSSELEHLSNTRDHLHFLQSFPSLSTIPRTEDWSDVHVHRPLHGWTTRTAVDLLEETFRSEVNKLGNAELQYIRQFAIDVTLDADTAHHQLMLSEDRKQVSHRDTSNNVPKSPKRFDTVTSVLGTEGFSQGKFYYEVQVEGKTKWTVGVAEGSTIRKGSLPNVPDYGFWTLWLRNENEYKANGGNVTLSLRQKPQNVGVFVDCEQGLVSFYDVDAMAHIYSYTGCTFLEKIYPYVNPCRNDSGTNSTPLILSKVIKNN